jgi:hypothetical protein
VQENISQGIRHGLWISRPAAKRRRQIFAARDMPRQFWMPGARKNPGNPKRIAGVLNTPGAKPSGQSRYLPAPEVHTVTFGSSHRRTRHAGPVLEPTFSRTVPPRPFRGIPEMRRPGCARFRTRRKGGAPRQPCRPRFPWAAAAHTGCGCIL